MPDPYEEEYFAGRIHDSLRTEMYRQEHRRLRQRTGLSGGTVLDVGCGLGEFLECFPADRWDRFGIEVSAFARRVAEERGVSFTLPGGERWCDLAIFRGTLQHLDRPLEMLANVLRWLRPGGRLCALATPNAGSIVYRLFQELPPLNPRLNYVVFSDRLLEQCLVNLGYVEVSFEYPYIGTPYASPVRDHARFMLRLLGVRRPFAFWGNMMECYARRP